MKKVPERSPLNIVPFIDIMLVLLCIVLSISTFIAQGKIEVKLPSASSSAPAEQKPSLLVEVNQAGTLHLDGQALPLEEFKAKLTDLPRSEHLQLRIDEQSQFGIFIGLINALKEQGHDNFSIATLQQR